MIKNHIEISNINKTEMNFKGYTNPGKTQINFKFTRAQSVEN